MGATVSFPVTVGASVALVSTSVGDCVVWFPAVVGASVSFEGTLTVGA